MTTKNRPTPRQGFLSNITSNIETLVESLESDLRYLHSILSNSNLKPDESISQQIIIATNHLQKTISKLKSIPESTFSEWCKLFEANPYW